MNAETKHGGAVDVLAVGSVTVSAKELEWLLTSPAALRVLADYNDYNETMADACGADASFSQARREWFNAEAARIEDEWEAERTPEQRVFVHNAAVAELIKAASMLEKEFRRIYPIYYYAEPWAHETNVPLKSVKAALANVGHKS